MSLARYKLANCWMNLRDSIYFISVWPPSAQDGHGSFLVMFRTPVEKEKRKTVVVVVVTVADRNSVLRVHLDLGMKQPLVKQFPAWHTHRQFNKEAFRPAREKGNVPKR